MLSIQILRTKYGFLNKELSISFLFGQRTSSLTWRPLKLLIQLSLASVAMAGLLCAGSFLDEVSHKYQVNSPASIATRVKVGGLNNHPLFETRTTYLLSKIEQNRIYLSNIFTLMAILLVSAWFIQTFQLNPNHQHRILICRYSSSSLSRRRFLGNHFSSLPRDEKLAPQE